MLLDNVKHTKNNNNFDLFQNTRNNQQFQYKNFIPHKKNNQFTLLSDIYNYCINIEKGARMQ